ncbi:hypothetical protein [Sphingomonas sp.]|jgi:hypothetical protein|uniref:hypothetical protein n=1 Tax=Sphingomonas sp. TaxID=28214 RepID=UPI002ED821AC
MTEHAAMSGRRAPHLQHRNGIYHLRVLRDGPYSHMAASGRDALEGIGVANADLLARIVAARLDRTWRNPMGGDCPVLAELTRQMAESNHCQAVCDLLLQATMAPAWVAEREAGLVAGTSELSRCIRDFSVAIEQRAIAVMAIGGGLIVHQAGTDPTRVFFVLGPQSILRMC